MALTEQQQKEVTAAKLEVRGFLQSYVFHSTEYKKSGKQIDKDCLDQIEGIIWRMMCK